MRVVEWNVGLKNDFKTICNRLCGVEPDIIVLTEVKKGQQKEYNKILASEFEVFANKISISNKYTNYNDVLIGVRKTLNSQPQEQAFNSYNEQPDWRRINLAYNGDKLSLIGVRFENYKVSIRAKREQLNCFYSELDGERERTIIVGDFNCNSYFTPAREGISWSLFKKTLFQHGFHYHDATNGQYTFSYQRDLCLRRNYIGTSPDNVFLSVKNNFIDDLKNVNYYWGDLEKETIKWPSDHAMIIIDLA